LHPKKKPGDRPLYKPVALRGRVSKRPVHTDPPLHKPVASSAKVVLIIGDVVSLLVVAGGEE
jgi:hypothetical protein